MAHKFSQSEVRFLTIASMEVAIHALDSLDAGKRDGGTMAECSTANEALKKILAIINKQ